jgi:hypothetical protein
LTTYVVARVQIEIDFDHPRKPYALAILKSDYPRRPTHHCDLGRHSSTQHILQTRPSRRASSDRFCTLRVWCCWPEYITAMLRSAGPRAHK